MMLVAGNKVKIKNNESFNERFVRVGDIAEVVEVSYDTYGWVILSNPTWEFEQYTNLSYCGYDLELIV